MKYLILLLTIVFLTLGICSCRTKKSTTDYKQTEIEKVLITDNSTVAKKETVQENNQETKNETITDKSFFEAWMQIKSDEATFEDKAGNKWTFKNPQMNQKSSQSNDIVKTEQTDVKQEKSAVVEETQQINVAVSNDRQIKTDLKTTDERKTKIVWVYWIGGLLIAGFGYLILKRFKLV